MKSLKFLMLSAFVMLGTSAFGAVSVKYNNVGYGLTSGGGDGTAADKAKAVLVEAVYATDNLTIADAFTKTNELDATTYYKVVGFASGWEASAETGAKDVKATLKTLTINAANMANLANAFTNLTLTSLTVTNATWTSASSVTSPMTDACAKTITTLDLSGLTKVEELGTTFKGATWAALTSITLPANLKTINTANAFLGSKITTMALGSVEEIGDNVFKEAALTAVDLSNIKKVGDYAFDGVTTITSLEIPATLATIGTDAFANMTAYDTDGNVTGGLTELTINRDATNNTVPAAFSGCAAVTTLTLKGAEVIDANAFADMPLTKIDLSKCPNLTSAAGAFKAGQALSKVKLAGSQVSVADIDLTTSANSLKSITFSAAETNIPATTFQGFTKLTDVTIPEGVTIGAYAFDGCSALATVTFVNETGLATTFIDDYAFQGTALTAVVLPENVDFGGAGDGTGAFEDCAVLKTFVAEGITTVPAAFTSCDKLKAVVLPGTVTTIADDAFNGLAKLASVKFNYDPEDPLQVLTSIGARAFQDCVALTEIDLSATKLDNLDNDDVFDGCTGLATITLPEEMNSLSGEGIFRGTAIETLDASMVDGTVDNIFGTDLTVDPQITNNSLKVLKLGNATILNDAFAGCTKLKILVTGAATIYPDAFGYCEKLATVTVDPYDEEDGTSASISMNAFDHCTALTTFNYSTEWIDMSDWGWISAQAFTYCTPYLTINATKEFAAYYGNAPVNATWSADALNAIVKTVQDKANPNQFVAKFWSPAYDAAFSAEDAKVYTVYVDGENAYFSACRADGGKYYINAGEHVILKTTEAKEVPFEVNPAMGKDAVAFDDMVSLPVDGELGDIQAALGVGTKDYIYRLTNTAEQGFGFTAYTSTTVKANQFFISTTKKPASGRLNIVWLDEDGNVEGDATAIQKIQNTDSKNGAIYNLQGVRVEKAQKGLYIQNGKKFIVK